MGDNVPLMLGTGCAVEDVRVAHKVADVLMWRVPSVRLAILVGWKGTREAEAGEESPPLYVVLP